MVSAHLYTGKDMSWFPPTILKTQYESWLFVHFKFTKSAHRVREGREFESQAGQILTQHRKRFTLTATQVAVLLCRYDAEMGNANSLHALT